MNRILLPICLTMLSFMMFSQENSSLEVFAGRSHHGTGDLQGFIIGFQNNKSLTPRLSWSLGLEATSNDSPDLPLIYQDPNGRTVDGTIHFVTTGLQIVVGLEYAFLQSQKHNLSLSLLPFFRYQATSINDVVGTLFPAGTGFPIPVRVIENINPARDYSPGASLRLNYSYKLKNQWSLGFMGGVQTDTNGDNLYYFGLKTGRFF